MTTTQTQHPVDRLNELIRALEAARATAERHLATRLGVAPSETLARLQSIYEPIWWRLKGVWRAETEVPQLEPQVRQAMQQIDEITTRALEDGEQREAARRRSLADMEQREYVNAFTPATLLQAIEQAGHQLALTADGAITCAPPGLDGRLKPAVLHHAPALRAELRRRAEVETLVPAPEAHA